MARSRNRSIVNLLRSSDGSIKRDRLRLSNEKALDSSRANSIVDDFRVSSHPTISDLPTSNLSKGDRAFVQIDSSNARLYVSNGSGWYNATLVNTTPYWDSAPLSSYDIADSATPLIITAKAKDSDNSDNNLLHQSIASDSAQYLVDITRDSSVFTFTPKSKDSVHSEVTAGNLTDSNSNDFIYTFKWSDGINFVTKAVTINYNFGLAPTAVGFRSLGGSSSKTQGNSYFNGSQQNVAIGLYSTASTTQAALDTWIDNLNGDQVDEIRFKYEDGTVDLELYILRPGNDYPGNTAYSTQVNTSGYFNNSGKIWIRFEQEQSYQEFGRAAGDDWAERVESTNSGEDGTLWSFTHIRAYKTNNSLISTFTNPQGL